jgi:hypothetical protein
MNTKSGLVVALLGALLLGACGGKTAVPTKEIESHRAGNLIVSLLSEGNGLAQGKNNFVVAFRTSEGDKPVDVGTVTVGSSMAMPGMAPMTAPIELSPAGETGKYVAKGEFAMSGAWRFEVRWNGPAGQGTTSFNTNVR